MIIALGFKARSGKDTVAAYLNTRFGFQVTAFAEALKRGCKEIFSLTDEQIYGNLKEVLDSYWGVTPRYILQRVGTECMRDGYDQDIWIRALEKKIQQAPDKHWVITDCRFPNEAAAVKRMGGYVVRVDRDGAGATGGIAAHPSETAMLNYNEWDMVIDNNGSLNQLYDKSERMVYSFLQERIMNGESL